MPKTLAPTTAEKAVELIHSGNNVYVQSVAGAPQTLLQAMADRDDLKDVRIFQLHTEGSAPYAQRGKEKNFRVQCFFVGGNMRKAVQEGRADYIPVFLSEIPNLFIRNIIPLDVAMVTVSPPDRNGYVTLGTSVDATLAAAKCAKRLIAEINPNMPRTTGDGTLHISEFDRVIAVNTPMPTVEMPALTDKERTIGRYIAELVEDGATLQMGIGAIPNAALEALQNHKGLGVHTEMFSDGLIDLIERNVVTNEHKTIHPYHTVTGFAFGSQRLYDFVHDNPKVRFLDIGYVNRTNVIRKNPKVTAINSAIEIDMTGQVCADSIGHRIFSGVGGQMDFVRGASLSPGGKPILALPSTTSKGVSRIVPYLNIGAGVVTTRAHVHYVVTEYGIANLYGKSLQERAHQLIQIAHPDHREGLAVACFECLKLKV